MTKDLTSSQIDRQNILNNDLAVEEIQKQTGAQGVVFEGRVRFSKAMVAKYFDVDVRTIERYVSENSDEISENGYEVLKGKRLKDFMDCLVKQDVPDINVGNISNRTPQIAIFDFKAFLNMAMLLVESENDVPSGDDPDQHSLLKDRDTVDAEPKHGHEDLHDRRIRGCGHDRANHDGRHLDVGDLLGRLLQVVVVVQQGVHGVIQEPVAAVVLVQFDLVLHDGVKDVVLADET